MDSQSQCIVTIDVKYNLKQKQPGCKEGIVKEITIIRTTTTESVISVAFIAIPWSHCDISPCCK